MKGKYKYLLNNIGLLTISKFGTSILAFLLVPLYTSVLSTEEYGSYDVVNSTVTLLVPILTINIATAVFRFSMDKEKSREEVFSIGLGHLILGTCAFGIVVAISVWVGIFEAISQYGLYIVLLFFCTAFYELISNFARGLERIVVFAIAGILSTLTLVLSSILFLLVFKWGLDGYFLAHILSSAIPAAFLSLAIHAEKYVCGSANGETAKSMRTYSIPLIANSIGWWVNNLSDRYIVVWLCGVAANGIYSVAYKIPTVLSMFHAIFNQAWVLSAIKNYREEGKEGFYGNIYKLYNFCNVILCSILIVFSQLIAKLLYAKDFFAAWKYVPFLLISAVFGGMAGFFGCIFSAAKQSRTFGRSTIIGAVINLVLNIVLVYFFGPMGAAIATVVSYFIVWMIRLIHVRRIVSIDLHLKRDALMYICLLLQAIITVSQMTILYKSILLITLLVMIAVLSYDEIRLLLTKGLRIERKDREAPEERN